ncbi:hypothetical protein CRUP_019662, partial [Coryphaenoides rupestris]
VRLVIHEKGLICEERDVSLPLQEHKEPWFMRLNLGEEVPVFIHGDTIVSDYNQIIDYMEKTFTGAAAVTAAAAYLRSAAASRPCLGHPAERGTDYAGCWKRARCSSPALNLHSYSSTPAWEEGALKQPA